MSNVLPFDPVRRMHAQVERFNREIIGLPIPSEPQLLSPERLKFGVGHIREELQEIEQAHKTGDVEQAADGWLDLIYVAHGRLLEMGFPTTAGFDAVHEANMGKVRGTLSKRPGSLGFDAVKPDGWTAPDLRPYLNVTADMFHGFFTDEAHTVHHQEIDRDPDSSPLNILVLGHARSGKDTVSEMLRDQRGFSFTSSSWFCAENIVFPVLSPIYGYETVEDCFHDRGNHRAEWYELISQFNTPDASALGSVIFEENNIYCGLRHRTEFFALKNSGIVDLTIWVDAALRVEDEPFDSCSVEPWMADIVIDNNRDLEALERNVYQVLEAIDHAEAEIYG